MVLTDTWSGAHGTGCDIPKAAWCVSPPLHERISSTCAPRQRDAELSLGRGDPLVGQRWTSAIREPDHQRVPANQRIDHRRNVPGGPSIEAGPPPTASLPCGTVGP